MNQSYNLRLATQDDVGPLTHLFLDYNEEYNISLDENSVFKKTFDLLAKCLSVETHTVYIATSNAGLVIGFSVVHWIPFMWLHGMEGYISEMLIHADHRGNGVGHQLLAIVEKEAMKRGCFRLILNNFHIQESYKRNFYIKNGFTERVGVGNFIKELQKK